MKRRKYQILESRKEKKGRDQDKNEKMLHDFFSFTTTAQHHNTNLLVSLC